MAKAATGVQAAIGGGCAILKRIIKSIEARIRTEQTRLRTMRATLKKLEGQPKPDAAQIKALKKSIEVLQAQIGKDEEDLRAVQDDFSMFCSG